MRNERYDVIIASDAMIFEFTSIGPKGEIPKLVMYSAMADPNVYNLAFGDKDINTGKIDDLVVTDNKDSQKVLATVASTIHAFVSKYPRAWITVSGSTKARTRLYQMGISSNLEEITMDFFVLGKKEGKWYPFEKNIGYEAFLITLKENIIWTIS